VRILSWAERLKNKLKELNIEFESEAEAIRISLPGGAQIETVEGRSGEVALSFSIPLPSEGPDDPNYYLNALTEAFTIMLNIDKSYRYEIDESIPGYPLLRVYIDFKSGDELTDKLIKSLEKSLKHIKKSI
jgi:hypothetical protein